MLPTIHSLQKPFADLSNNVVFPGFVIAEAIEQDSAIFFNI